MPRLNSRGQVCAGVGDGQVSIDKVQVANGGGTQWLDDDRVMFGGHWTDGTWKTLVYNQRTKEVTRLLDIDATELVASGGQWFVSGPKGVAASFPVDATTRITPASTDGRGAADRQGTIALTNTTGLGFVLHPKDAAPTGVLAPGVPMYNLTVVSPTQALWPQDGGFATLNLPPIQVAAPPGRGCYCIVNDRPWVVYYAFNIGLIAHPTDDASRYVLVAKDNFFHYDAMAFNGTIRVTYALTAAEAPEEVVIEDLDLTKLVSPEPEPLPVKPTINFLNYNAVLQQGRPWQAQFEVNGTTFTVKIDEQSNLKVRAENSDGADETGVQRPVVILSSLPGLPFPMPEIPQIPVEPEPEPNPIPVPVRSERFVLAPSPAAADLVNIVDIPGALDGVDVFQFYTQQIMSDDPIPNWGPNGFSHIKSMLPKLKALGIKTSVELGTVKPQDPKSESTINTVEDLITRIENAGGTVDFLCMDEPLTSGKQLGQSPQETAGYVSKFIAKVKALRPNIKVVHIEAWPFVDFGTIRDFSNALTVQPDYTRLDVNWHDADAQRQDPMQFIHTMDARGPVSILVNATVDPIATDAEHDANLVALANKLKLILPNAPQITVQSWASRAVNAPQDVPNNLGEHGMLATFQKVRSIFAGTVVPPVPEPIPTEPVVLKSTVSEDPIVVKTVKPVQGTKLSTLILPDDKVYSCQPDGSDGVRDSGTEGDFEKCRVSGNLATFKPVKTDNKYFTKTFVETEEL